MLAVRLIDRDELLRRFAPYECRLLHVNPSGFELWETGWGEPFTMWPENGLYEEATYFDILAGIIGPTMPSNWNGKP
jgi:hypothetical protein